MIGRWLVAILGGLVLLGSGCGGGAEAEPGSYAEMLRFVPNDPSYRQRVTIIDYEALRALPLTADAPNDPTALERLVWATEYYTGDGPAVPLGSRELIAWPQIVDNWELGFGFTLDDVERELSFRGPTVAGQPPGYTEIWLAVGDFDDEAVGGRLASCAECEPHEASEHEGWAIMSWPEGIDLEPAKRLAPPMRNNLGHGGSITITSERIVRADRLVMLNAALDARERDASEPREDALQALAKVLEPLSLLVVQFSQWSSGPEMSAATARPIPGFSAKVNEDRLRWDPPASEVRLRPYVAFALGGGIEGMEPVMTIALLHDTEAEASENVVRLGERLATTTTLEGVAWSELFSSWSIVAEGRVVVATLQGTPRWGIGGRGWDPLLLHE
jgi:hypothetical protein